MPDARRIVICSLETWDEVWRRNQYLVDWLLRDDPQLEVLFVEPPADPLHALTRGRFPRPGTGLREIAGYQGRLRAVQLTKLLPRQFGALADRLLLQGVSRTVRRLGWRDPYLWINDPGWSALVRSTGWTSLYDITDDWVEADRGEREHRRLELADAELLALCAEVVACSTGLVRTKGKTRPVTLIRNGVDVARYRREHDRPADLPDERFALYVGTLHEDRLDVDLVLATARRLEETGGRLVLVGPNVLNADNSARLASSPAIIALGSRAKETIPAYLQHAHALVVPHLIDDFTESLDPIKLYEYLAVGRPIISTGVAGFRDEEGTPGVWIADDGRFVDAVLAATAEWIPTRIHTGVADWSDRGRDMRTVIDRLDSARS